MSPRIDAHAHFFFPGYVEQLPESCRRQEPDEVTLYQAYCQQHEISQVLAVGFEGEAWATGNNDYLAGLAARFSWLRPVAFVADPSRLTVAQLVTWQRQRFVGISLYIMTPDAAAMLAQVSADVWQWMVDKAWLISVNSTGELWSSWLEVLTSNPESRILIAHLGIPPVVTSAPLLDEAATALLAVTQLATFPFTYVKFSGFYALASPSYAYPHTASWPYAEVITKSFGTKRILWASDFSPALEHVSFPQTVEVLTAMPWLTKADLSAIFYDNLSGLLQVTDERIPTP